MSEHYYYTIYGQQKIRQYLKEAERERLAREATRSQRGVLAALVDTVRGLIDGVNARPRPMAHAGGRFEATHGVSLRSYR